MTSDKNRLSLSWKVFKTTYEFLRPVLSIVAVICMFLCCLRSKEGSHARLYSALLLGGSAAILLATKIIHKCMMKKDVYRIYRSGAARRLEPRELIPLCVITVIFMIPFYMVFITAFKNTVEANQLRFTWWPEQGFSMDSFREVFTVGDIVGLNMWRSLLNSLVYTMIPLVVGLIVACLAAYAFAKLNFRNKKRMYQLLIATMMMPGCVTMATGYMMYDWYHWTNSPLPLIIPGCFSGAGTVMFLREYFMGIPDSMLEAARTDGAGKWRCFVHILMPMARPAIITQFIMGFIGGFNDFMGPLIYLNDPEGYTIQVALSFMSTLTFDNSVVASACVITLVPMLVLYLIFQKYIINGISLSSGLKG